MATTGEIAVKKAMALARVLKAAETFEKALEADPSLCELAKVRDVLREIQEEGAKGN